MLVFVCETNCSWIREFLNENRIFIDVLHLINYFYYPEIAFHLLQLQ